jgi:hypothetical protein
MLAALIAGATVLEIETSNILVETRVNAGDRLSSILEVHAQNYFILNLQMSLNFKDMPNYRANCRRGKVIDSYQGGLLFES